MTGYIFETMVEFYTEYEVSVVPFTGAGEGASSLDTVATPEGGMCGSVLLVSEHFSGSFYGYFGVQ